MELRGAIVLCDSFIDIFSTWIFGSFLACSLLIAELAFLRSVCTAWWQGWETRFLMLKPF